MLTCPQPLPLCPRPSTILYSQPLPTHTNLEPFPPHALHSPAGQQLYTLALHLSSLGDHDTADPLLSKHLGCRPSSALVLESPLGSDAQQAVAAALDPLSPYWPDHCYGEDSTPFFSYLYPLAQPPSDIIERAITDLAAVLKRCPHTAAAMEGVVAAEWWAHCRDPRDPHQLHFDVDERALRQATSYKRVHPVLSSVLFMGQTGGPTLVLDQNPLQPLADKAWAVHPSPGRYLVFPGDMLHGVLPGLDSTAGEAASGHDGAAAATHGNRRVTLIVAWWGPDILHPSSSPVPTSSKARTSSSSRNTRSTRSTRSGDSSSSSSPTGSSSSDDSSSGSGSPRPHTRAHPALHACMAPPHSESEATAVDRCNAAARPPHVGGPPGAPPQPCSDPQHAPTGAGAGAKASSQPGGSPDPEPDPDPEPPVSAPGQHSTHRGAELHHIHRDTGQCRGVVGQDASMRSGAAGASLMTWPGFFRGLLRHLRTRTRPRQVTDGGIVTPAGVGGARSAAGAVGMRVAAARGLRVAAGHGSGGERAPAVAGGWGAGCGGSDDDHEICFCVPPAVTPAWQFIGTDCGDCGEGGAFTAGPPQGAGPELRLIGNGVTRFDRGRSGQRPSCLEGLQERVLTDHGRTQAQTPGGPHSKPDDWVESRATGALGVAPQDGNEKSVQGGDELGAHAAAAMAAAVADTLPPFKFFLIHDREVHDTYVMLEGCGSDASAGVAESG
ncbi:MAG: hypothetical protein WDW38_008962 [Sanguina aurantia]